MLSVSYLVKKCCLMFGTRVKGMYLGNELSTLKFKSFCTRLNDKMLARTKRNIYRVSQNSRIPNSERCRGSLR
jgi:hypothetical protein